MNKKQTNEFKNLIINNFGYDLWEEMEHALNKSFIPQDVHDKLLNYYSSEIEVQNKKISELKEKLNNEERLRKTAQSELQTYKKYQVYFEQQQFDNYVFGDNLPEIKKIFRFLKMNRAYLYSWGYFCHNIQKQTDSILHFNLAHKELTNEDLGYLICRLEDYFKFEDVLYKNWFIHRVEISTTHSNNINLNSFYKKYVRNYKNTKSKPNHFNEINALFN